MFKRLDNIIRKPIKIYFEGEEIDALEGDTVASALLSAGIIDFRQSAVSNSQRGPYCMMGACFECLVEIDGLGQRQACLVDIKNEMQVRRESAKRSVTNDL